MKRRRKKPCSVCGHQEKKESGERGERKGKVMKGSYECIHTEHFKEDSEKKLEENLSDSERKTYQYSTRGTVERQDGHSPLLPPSPENLLVCLVTFGRLSNVVLVHFSSIYKSVIFGVVLVTYMVLITGKSLPEAQNT